MEEYNKASGRSTFFLFCLVFALALLTLDLENRGYRVEHRRAEAAYQPTVIQLQDKKIGGCVERTYDHELGIVCYTCYDKSISCVLLDLPKG